MGEVFYPVYKHLAGLHHLYTLRSFEERLFEEGKKVLEYEDVIVFEKDISWTNQEIWFKNKVTLEKVRLKFLNAGIEAEDTPDGDGHILLMKEPKGA